MVCGVPIIASNLPEISKIIDATEFGVTVDSESDSEISQALNDIVGNENLRKSYAKNALNNAKNYSWENQEKHFLNLFLLLI